MSRKTKVVLHFNTLKERHSDRVVVIKTDAANMLTILRYAVMGMEEDPIKVSDEQIETLKKMRDAVDTDLHGDGVYAKPFKHIKGSHELTYEL